MTHDLWAALNGHIFSFLRSVTLARLVAEQRQKQAEKQDVTVMQDHRPAATPRATEPAVVS
jgi:Rrf2 family iron-sulfur cluster assembly transcriptional regulator